VRVWLHPRRVGPAVGLDLKRTQAVSPAVASSRRLAAIVFTDMVGGTTLSQANEAEFLRLRDEQAELVRPLFATHQGREVKSMGDGCLAEFGSALRAVECAIDIQQRLVARNSRVGGRPIQLRIGIHLGDVEVRGADILGDSVNVASRIEALADPGGICVTGPVFEQVRNKISNGLEKLAPRSLKNVQFPVDVYRVVLPWKVGRSATAESEPSGIAVLPFANISPDPKDEYFADGLTEELISVLSQLRGLRVIARTSVAPYRSTSKGVSQIGAELRVSSVLEGSVRKAGNRLRITAQLIDVRTEGHLWSQSFDRELDDVFALQAELAKQVANVLEVKLGVSEAARLDKRLPIRSDSYLAYLHGRSLMRGATASLAESLEAAKEQFEKAISLDDRNAPAYSGLADALRYIVYSSQGEVRTKSDAEGRRLVGRALELDPGLAEAHASRALIIWDDFEYAAAEREYRTALSLNPSYSFAHSYYGILLEDEGRPHDALRELELAEAADPLWPENLLHLARLLGWMGRAEEASTKVQKIGELAPRGEVYFTAQAWYYRAVGDADAFGKAIDLTGFSEPTPRAERIGRAMTYALSGEKEKARAILQQADARPDALNIASICAMAYGDIGDLDGCFAWLDRACEKHALMLQPFRLDPRLENVRKDPRFSVLLRRMNLE
jgi:adenylate cyclase